MIILILTAFSCSNISAPNGNKGSVIGGGATGETRTLIVTIDGIEDSSWRSAIPVGSSARTITHDAAWENTALSFYIEGNTNTAGVSNLTLTKINDKFDTSAHPDKSQFTMELDAAVWDLDLYACLLSDESGSGDFLSTSDKKDKAVLVGHASVDLTRYQGKANFTLSAEDLTRTASVSINFTAPWFADAGLKYYEKYNVKAGLYNLATGNMIDEKDSLGGTNDGELASNKDGAYEYATAKPGTYTFAVTFTDKTDPTIEFAWSDKIIIEPGHDIAITTPIVIPNLFGAKPEAPSNFVAYYSNPGEDALEAGLYPLAFRWKDNSKIEQYFEIELADISACDFADNTATNYVNVSTIFTGANMETDVYENNDVMASTIVKTYGKDSYGDMQRVGGSLTKNNEHFAVNAQLGKVYVARIRAVNMAGPSDWAYVGRAVAKVADADADKTYYNDATKTDLPIPQSTDDLNLTSPSVFHTSSKALNVFRIVYMFQGGGYQLYTGATPTLSGTDITSNYITYSSYEKDILKKVERTPAVAGDLSNYDLKEGDTLFSNLPKYREGYFSNWYTLTDGVKAEVTATKYNGPENITYYAEYQATLDGSVTVYDKRAYKFEDSWFAATNFTAADATHPNPYISVADALGTDKTYGTADDAPPTWTFTIPTSAQVAGTPFNEAEFAYEMICCTIRPVLNTNAIYYAATQHKVKVNDARAFAPDISSYQEGTYTATFDAYINNAIVSSYVYTFQVTQ